MVGWDEKQEKRCITVVPRAPDDEDVHVISAFCHQYNVSIQLRFLVEGKKKRRTTNIGGKAQSSSISLDTNVIAHVNNPRDIATHDSMNMVDFR
jgi:hypothetical protein